MLGIRIGVSIENEEIRFEEVASNTGQLVATKCRELFIPTIMLVNERTQIIISAVGNC